MVPSEDPWSALADGVVLGGSGPLAAHLPDLGIRYVLVEGTGATETGPATRRLLGLRLVLRSADLMLYRSDGPARVPVFRTPPAIPVVIGDVLAALGFLVAFVVWAGGRGLPGVRRIALGILTRSDR